MKVQLDLDLFKKFCDQQPVNPEEGIFQNKMYATVLLEYFDYIGATGAREEMKKMIAFFTVKELTVEEISKLLGYTVKVVQS